ncbi:DnaA regulatory inactivator Hda [Alteromonas facilis]|uniref:DnaA regulatory inactivator Hda n=1 Tax=Alteromonas facilis TaxID=2048004 RepID=UPI000C28F808|nr:DnaA regulatory inactivator Hda [Alteromonas facilis]
MQLTLPVQLPVEKKLSNFIVGENSPLVAHACDALENLLTNQNGYQQLYLHAEKGSGKSHFMYAMCHRANESGIESFYLSLARCEDYSPELLAGFRDIPLLCIDDIQHIYDKKDWQVAIFDLINQRREVDSGALFIASDVTLAQFQSCVPVVLPDLLSRLQWGAVYGLKPLTDAQKQELIALLAAVKGIKFSDKAISYLLNHCERSTRILVDTIERLDQRSLREQKALTVDLIKRELGL